MGIAYIDKPPLVDPLNGLFLVTAQSGGESVQLILTRHALIGFQAHSAKAEAIAALDELDFEPSPFTLRQAGAAAGEAGNGK